MAKRSCHKVSARQGDHYVLDEMRVHGYNIGGEPNGHIILSDYATTGDGFVAALQVLAVAANENIGFNTWLDAA